MKNHTLIYARFMDNDRTTIQAQWSDNNDPGTIRETYIMADESDVEYERLLNLIDLDQIHENTVKFYKRANRDIMKYMEKVYKKWVKESNKSLEVITKSPITSDTNVFHVTTENMSGDSMTLTLNLLVKILFEDFNSEKYTESLFHFKLSLFELDFVKESNNRVLKSQMRKSKTPLELLNSVIGIYNEVHNGSHNAESDKKVS